MVEELVYRHEVAWQDLSTASVVSGGKRYWPKVRRKASVLPIAFLGGCSGGVGGDCSVGYVVGGVRGVTRNVGGCGGVSGCTSHGPRCGSIGCTGRGAGRNCGGAGFAHL